MNYATIKSTTLAFVDRASSSEINAEFDNLIVLVEARINRLLKTREQTARAYIDAQTNKEFYALPSDWRGMRDIQIDTGNATVPGYSSSPISLIDPKGFERKKKQAASGNWYCIIDNQLQLYPKPVDGCSIQIVYYQKVPNLNATDDENWITGSNPDIYISGLSGQVSLFFKDYDAAKGHFGLMETYIGELESVDWEERWSGDPLVIRTDSQ